MTASPKSRLACIPAIPPPITSALLLQVNKEKKVAHCETPTAISVSLQLRFYLSDAPMNIAHGYLPFQNNTDLFFLY